MTDRGLNRSGPRNVCNMHINRSGIGAGRAVRDVAAEAGRTGSVELVAGLRAVWARCRRR